MNNSALKGQQLLTFQRAALAFNLFKTKLDADINKKLAATETRVTAVESDIAALKTDVKEVKSDVSTTKNDLSTLSQTVTGITEDVSSIDSISENDLDSLLED